MMTNYIDITQPIMTRSGKIVYNVRRGAGGNILGLILNWGTEEWRPDGTHIHNRTGKPNRNDLIQRSIAP